MRLAGPLLIASGAFWPGVCLAQSGAAGLSGLGEAQTTEVVADKHIRMTVVPARLSSLDGNGPVDRRLVSSFAGTVGFKDRLELGIYAPVLQHEEESGLGNLTIMAKGRIPGQRELAKATLQAAVSGYVELPSGSVSNDYASGSPGFGAALVGSAERKRAFAGASLGFGTSDYCPNCTVPGAQLANPRSVGVLRGSLGGGVRLRYLQPFLELHALTALNGVDQGDYPGDPDLYALAGARAGPVKGFSAAAYVGTGLANGSGGNTETLFGARLAFTFGLADIKKAKP